VLKLSSMPSLKEVEEFEAKVNGFLNVVKNIELFCELAGKANNVVIATFHDNPRSLSIITTFEEQLGAANGSGPRVTLFSFTFNMSSMLLAPINVAQWPVEPEATCATGSEIKVRSLNLNEAKLRELYTKLFALAIEKLNTRSRR